MDKVKVIEIQKRVFENNDLEAELVRKQLKVDKTFMMNLMSSPGSGKTTMLVETIELLKDQMKMGVIEADIDSDVDAHTIASTGVRVNQLHSGGMCHLDAGMAKIGLDDIGSNELDFVVIENIGNLICPAGYDLGESLKVMILSVPEGDDKPLKYPKMFSNVDVLLISKIDACSIFNFDFDAVYKRVQSINPSIKMFKISAVTGEGMQEWCSYLKDRANDWNQSYGDYMTDQIKLLEFVNKVSMTKMGSKKGVTINDPRFKLLEKIVTEEMAEVALALEYRVHLTVDEISKKCGKSVDRTRTLLWDLAMAGVSTVKKENGIDTFWYETWVPGIFEMVVNNKELVRKHPQIAKAFDDYGHLKNPVAAGNIPIGKGVMRVIPIESAIDGETRRASSEEVSGYIRKARLLSVSDCSCRTSREEMGEGCGHLKEEMCIQLDDAAEYYIRTERGREVTKEEALEIIRKAERDGLMHQIPNTEGEGHTHAICNCCGCSCYAIRAAGMYNNPDMVRSNYVSKVDADNCVGCGECIDVCPSGAIMLGEKLCASIESQTPIHEDLPSDTVWGPDKWNPDYRVNRKESLETGTSPCKTSCPAHISIPGYIKLASQGRYREALEMIKQENPFPAVCGRVCPALCESECTRGDLDAPVAIDDVKKFLAELDLSEQSRFIPEIKNKYEKKIAIVGAGPAGLSCAYYLAVEGYKVTVFEKQKELGGMLQFGIPSYRLEKDVIQAEIDVLKTLGITFESGTEVGKDVTIQDLRVQGYQAFFIAIGAQNGRNLGLENEDAMNIETGVSFLRNSAFGNQKRLSGNVVVIGGGNVAIDVARSAVRYGAEKVQMVCLESKDEMPALEEEILEAIHEGIEITGSYGPEKYEVHNGKVEGVWFKKCLNVFDKDRQFNPSYDETDKILVNADHVIIAVGQSIAWNELLVGTSVTLNTNNTIIVDSVTLQSSEADIFAGGDVVTGPRFAIDAIALGKEGAVSIHRYVQRGQDLVYGRRRKEYTAFDKSQVDFSSYDRIKRESSSTRSIQVLNGDFSDPRGTLTELQVKNETLRCLSCGVTVVDEFMCVGCGACTTRCKFDAAKLYKKYNETGVDFSELKPVIVKHAIKRKAKIAVKKVKRVVMKETR